MKASTEGTIALVNHEHEWQLIEEMTGLLLRLFESEQGGRGGQGGQGRGVCDLFRIAIVIQSELFIPKLLYLFFH